MGRLYLLRHGEARYQQKEVETDKRFYKSAEFLNKFREVKDLRESGVSRLRNSVNVFLNCHIDELENKEISVWVSPYARTIQTAHNMVKALTQRGLDPEKICFFDKIGEVKNFDFSIMKALVEGGEVEISGEKKLLHKEKTNPDDLSFSEYFSNSRWLDIDRPYLEEKGVLEEITSIESFESVTQRSKSTLSKVLNMTGEDKCVIIVSHQAFTDRILKENENYENGGQRPGEVLYFDAEGNYERYFE